MTAPTFVPQKFREALEAPSSLVDIAYTRSLIAFEDVEDGRYKITCSYPALGVELIVTVIPSKVSTVTRAANAITKLNDRVALGDCSVEEGLELLEKKVTVMIRNSKKIFGDPIPRKVATDLSSDTLPAAAPVKVAAPKATTVPRVVTTSDGRYTVNTVSGEVRPVDEIPQFIADMMPSIRTVRLDAGEAVEYLVEVQQPANIVDEVQEFEYAAAVDLVGEIESILLKAV